MATHLILSMFLFQAEAAEVAITERTDFDRVIELAELLALPVLLPLALVWITSRSSRKQAADATKAARETESAREERQRTVTDEDALLDRHKRLIAILYQLLSDVQLRHVRAQCSDLDEDECVGLDNDEFQGRIQTAQEQLSAEYLFVGSAVINQLYEFIAELTEMMVRVQRIKSSDEDNKRSLETTVIFETAERAADILTRLQADLIKQHAARMKSEFEPGAVPLVRNCCGVPPSDLQRKQLELYLAQVEIDREEKAVNAAGVAVATPPTAS